jgi:AcrR family transcriptional regulator
MRVTGRSEQSIDRGGRIETPRERILTAASLLFTQQGIGRTGVDLLIATAGVAKATFYRHFRSKDDLVVDWLHDGRTRWFDRVRTIAEAAGDEPDIQILAVYEAAADWLEGADYRGCPFLNTAVELEDPEGRAAESIRAHIAEIGGFFSERTAAAGHRDAAGLARELHALLAGSIALGVVNRTSAHALAARDAAERLLGTRLSKAS